VSAHQTRFAAPTIRAGAAVTHVRTPLTGGILSVLALLASSTVVAKAGAIVRASAAGAHLDTHLLKGGGTDDTAVLQRLLDSASGGRPVHLILDGPALVSGLNIYGNTTLECTAGAGLYLKDGSSRAILRNAHRSRGPVLDEHINIRGCFLNGNRRNQPSANIPRPDLPNYTLPSGREKDGTFISGLQFLGVNYLVIDGVTLWNVRAFGALIANASYVDIHNVIVDDGGGANADLDEYDVTDGLHFKGPLRYVSIDSVKFRVGDDGIAFNANDFETDDVTTRNDFGPYVGQGPITDVTVSNVDFMAGQVCGIRILSTNELVDRIVISNVTGVVRAFLLEISHWVNPTSFGNVGSVSISNVTVDPQPSAYDRLPFISIDGRMKALSFQGLTTALLNERPVIQIGPKASVGAIDLDVTAIDPNLVGNILRLEEGGRVEHMKIALNWQGPAVDQGKDPVIGSRGAIADLQWVDTPPLYVEGHVAAGDRSSLDVSFTQKLKEPVSGRGSTLKVNGQPRTIIRATLQPDGKTVRYSLASPLKSSDRVEWSYDGGRGDLRSLDGLEVHSVSLRVIQAANAPSH